jgi:hypothetical protein
MIFNMNIKGKHPREEQNKDGDSRLEWKEYHRKKLSNDCGKTDIN